MILDITEFNDRMGKLTPLTGENMKSIKICLVLALLLTSVFSAHAAGKVFFAAPNGSPTNNGSQASPWDLQTALANRSRQVTAGDTIYLRGGVYKGTFISTLVGAPGSPITVRSLPGEWAIIDNNQTLTLATAIGTERRGTITFAGDVNLPDPCVVMIDDEQIQIIKRVGNSFSINARGWSGSRPVSHAAGAVAKVISETFRIEGSDVVFGNFEVTNSQVERVIPVPGSNSVHFNRRYAGIVVFAPRSKVINTVVHETGQGISFWSPAVDSEIYGNILYNNGEEAPDRGHGHGIYSQNTTGRKFVEENITFGNFGTFGLQVYGSANANLRGYTIRGNINFLNQYMVGGNAPADDIILDSNLLFGVPYRMGYGNPDNGSVTLTNNYSVSPIPVEIMSWQRVSMSGNRFYQTDSYTGANVVITLPPAGTSVLPQYQINNNRYIFARSFMDRPFSIFNPSKTTYSFTQWQGLGFDKNSTWIGATSTSQNLMKPTGVDIFYRPNKYERGRAHIAIYNYDKVPAVNIDLSKTGLAPGQRFEIRNGQNFKAPPIFAGTYSSPTVSVNVSNLRIAQPTGNSSFRNPEIASEFSVLVVVPLP